MSDPEIIDVEPIGAESVSTELAVSYQAATITDNLAALSAYIDQQLEPYIGSVVDPNDAKKIKEARSCMADLNKLKEPIEAERKRIKREYEAPLKEFEARVKGITEKIDAARDGIKRQVDEADRMFKERRIAALQEEYEGVAGPVASVIPLEALIEGEWLRRSTIESKALQKLDEKALDTYESYCRLEGMALNHPDEVMETFCQTVDLSKALAKEQELNRRDEELAAFKKAQEALKKPSAPEPEPSPASEPEKAPEAPQGRPQEPVFAYELAAAFTGTQELAKKVAFALHELGVNGSIKRKGAIQ